jgi:hypothetical protein
MFNLADYETVEKRLGYVVNAKSFWEDHPNGRVSTEMEVCERDRYVFKAYLFKDLKDDTPFSTGYAGEIVTDRGVNSTSALENAETSAIGRALANAGYATKGKRPSREEMAKVVALKPAKPSVAEVQAKPDQQDYWTTPVNEYNKVVDAPVTLEKAMENIAAVMGTGEAQESPSCKHGSMQWREGEKNGKAWGGFMCSVVNHQGGEPKCSAIWYVVGSDGKWQPQKPRG